MARPLRIKYASAFYHVTSRAGKEDRQVLQRDNAPEGFRLCLSEGPGGTERLEMDDLAMERTKRC